MQQASKIKINFQWMTNKSTTHLRPSIQDNPGELVTEKHSLTNSLSLGIILYL